MTPKERARKIIRELEADARKRDMPRMAFDDTFDQIDCAIYAAVLEEREACAKIVDEARERITAKNYQADVGRRFATAIAEKIRERKGEGEQ